MPRLKGQRSASSWPDIHIETLKRLWGEGKTAGAIANAVPYSRSAVCAMARRQGLPSRPRAVPPRPQSLRKKLELAISLVAEHSTSLGAAAEQSKLTYRDVRLCFDSLVARYDMGNRPGAGDDLVTPVRR